MLERSSLPTRRRLVRRRRGRRRLAVLVAALVLLAVGAAVGLDRLERGIGPSRVSAAAPIPPEPLAQATLGPLHAPFAGDARDEVDPRFRRPPRGGLLVDVDSGAVLWRRGPNRALPIASLTKMMTGLVATERLRSTDRVLITRRILNYSGSGMGVLPRGRRIGVETLLYGLMLPSGNDAARALALRTSGSLRGFVAAMNQRATRLGLRCTRFASVEGLSDGNRSCPRDLAVLAGQVLDTPRLARIVRRPRAVIRMPIEGGRAFLYNHNPIVRERYRGALGVKTGYTRAAGRCLVAAASRGGRRLVAVVLDSPDPGRQARRLLDRGFAAAGSAR